MEREARGGRTGAGEVHHADSEVQERSKHEGRWDSEDRHNRGSQGGGAGAEPADSELRVEGLGREAQWGD